MTEQLFLIAQVAGRGVAIDSAQVESVVDIGHVTPTPRVARHIRGLAALRSRVVTVVDAHAALGLPPMGIAGSRAVITVIDGHHYAVLVDSLQDVAAFSAAPLPSGIALDGGWRQVGCGQVERDGEPILAIDLTALVQGPLVDGVAVN
ncbi:chemotaxis protein CheW [Sphingomonas sp.]|jgi:purine-binding chemotaxis protein CheW|uniref:chemotaxis protein CheW n=1 Tax=Sphingomonas sp. TaxID=28214 RepID=UPI002E362203|nr:chemotaxis protein CheW [Sphingomonas sp.]HEX4693908.1 chemotaxis protein CheW [Sphingomonas sp.]